MGGDILGRAAAWCAANWGFLSADRWENTIVGMPAALITIGVAAPKLLKFFKWSRAPFRAFKADPADLHILIADLMHDDKGQVRELLSDGIDVWAKKNQLPVRVHELRRKIEFRERFDERQRGRVALQLQEWLSLTGYDVLIWGEWVAGSGSGGTLKLRFAVRQIGFDKSKPEDVRPLTNYALQTLDLETLPENIGRSVSHVLGEAVLRFFAAASSVQLDSALGEANSEFLNHAAIKGCSVLKADSACFPDDILIEVAKEVFRLSAHDTSASSPSLQALKIIQHKVDAANDETDSSRWRLHKELSELDLCAEQETPSALEEKISESQAMLVASDSAFNKMIHGFRLCAFGQFQNEILDVNRGLDFIKAACEEYTYATAPDLRLEIDYRCGRVCGGIAPFGHLDHAERAIEIARAAMVHCKSENEIQYIRLKAVEAHAIGVVANFQFDIKGLEDSVVAFRKALHGLNPERAPQIWQWAQMRLSRLLADSGSATQKSAYFQEAIDRGNSLFSYVRRDQSPASWITAHQIFAVVCSQMGTDLEIRLPKAIHDGLAHIRLALEECSTQKRTKLWARSQLILGDLLYELAKPTRDHSLWAAALAAFTTGLKHNSVEFDPYNAFVSTHRVGSLLKSMNEIDVSWASLDDAYEAFVRAKTIGDRLKISTRTFMRDMDEVEHLIALRDSDSIGQTRS